MNVILSVLLLLSPAHSFAEISPAAPAAPDSPITLEGSINLRDPFRRPVPKMAEGDEGGNVPELERYDLDKFKLVGVITGPKKHKALLTLPTGKMHIVTEDMRIGMRHGLIRRIGPGIVTVEEKVVNLLGQEEKVETTIEFENLKGKIE